MDSDDAIVWRNRFLALLDRTPLPTAICSVTGIIAVANPAMAALFNTRPSRLRNRRATDLFRPVVPSDYDRLVRNLTNGRRTTQTLSVRWADQTGELTVQAVGDPTGTGLMVTLQPNPPRPLLSARETEILNLVSAGETSASIATHMGMTADGVNYHLRKLMKRFNAPNRTALIKMAS